MSCKSRNPETKTLFQVILLDFSFSVLPTFWADKTVFYFKVTIAVEIIRLGFTDFRVVLSFLSLICPKDDPIGNFFVFEFSTDNAGPFSRSDRYL